MAKPRNFETPEDLFKAFEEYKRDIKIQENEWQRVNYVGKDGKRVSDPQKVPYTFEGFKRFCVKNYGNVHQYFDNQNGSYESYLEVCSRVREEIRENQIIGGMLGFYNPSITQRLNGLTDKQDIKQTIKVGMEIEDEYID